MSYETINRERRVNRAVRIILITVAVVVLLACVLLATIAVAVR